MNTQSKDINEGIGCFIILLGVAVVILAFGFIAYLGATIDLKKDSSEKDLYCREQLNSQAKDYELFSDWKMAYDKCIKK